MKSLIRLEDFEYIGAPGGGEDNIAKGTYLELHGAGYRHGLDYPKDKVESRQTINLQDTAQHSMDQCIKSLTGDVTERPKKQEIKDNTWEVGAGVYGTIRGMYPPVVDENYRLYDGRLINMKDYYVNGIFDAQAAIQAGVPTISAIKHMLDNKDYSKLSTVNINNGQDSTFCFNNNSCKDKPAQNNTFEELVNKQQEFKQRVQGSKPSDFLEEHIKLVDKLVNKSKTYRPLPACLTIKESNIDGLGVFATEDIILDRYYTFLGYTHYVVDGELFRVNYGGFVNHSNTPNCKLYAISKEENYEAYNLVPIVDIKAGTELTLDYTKELCGLSGYDGAEFLKEDNLEDRVYENSVGVKYYYNSMYGKYEIGSLQNVGYSYPIFYTPKDAEKYLKRVE